MLYHQKSLNNFQLSCKSPCPLQNTTTVSVTLLWKSWAGGQCVSFGLWGFAGWVALLAEPCGWAQPCGDLPSAWWELCSWKSQTNRVIPQLLSGEISKHGNQGWKKERTTAFLRLCVIPPQQFLTNSAKLLHKTFPWGESILGEAEISARAQQAFHSWWSTNRNI